VGNRTKYHVRKRKFLNHEFDMTAFIVGIVEDTRDYPDEDENAWKWGKIELMLADCSRKVSFCFDMSDPAERANSLFKIEQIAEVVNAVKEALKIEAQSMGKRRVPIPNEDNG
jgi:hypothetical protein